MENIGTGAYASSPQVRLKGDMFEDNMKMDSIFRNGIYEDHAYCMRKHSHSRLYQSSTKIDKSRAYRYRRK
eukprot:13034310-Heterocapsa_arctica.AAC.1